MLGEGIGPIFLDQLMCNGSEASLLECLPSENIGLHNCHHNEDAGVRCEGVYGHRICVMHDKKNEPATVVHVNHHYFLLLCGCLPP